MPASRKFPYRSEFPDSGERAGRHQTLEDALSWARHLLHGVWREDTEYGRTGDYIHDTTTAVITNRDTGYRWILRRHDWSVEFQTAEMLEDKTAQETIHLTLTIEEAEALADQAKNPGHSGKRTRALGNQALDQIGLLCRQVRERVRLADELIDPWTKTIPRSSPPAPEPEAIADIEDKPPAPKPRYRPLGEPDNLSLKEAGEILGKARNTLHGWYRAGKFPPAVDVSHYMPYGNKPVIVVPRYRLEAWQKGERMPAIFEAVFQGHGLYEAPWVCFTRRRGAAKADLDFWVGRLSLVKAHSNDGRRIYGDLNEERVYELSSRDV